MPFVLFAVVQGIEHLEDLRLVFGGSCLSVMPVHNLPYCFSPHIYGRWEEDERNRDKGTKKNKKKGRKGRKGRTKDKNTPLASGSCFCPFGISLVPPSRPLHRQ